MTVFKKWQFVTALLALLLAGSVSDGAEIDTVYRKSDAKGIGGQITSISKTEIIVTQKIGNRQEHIPVNEIERVEWQGEPPILNLARSNENAGNLAAALSGYQSALETVAASNENLRADIEFLMARTAARSAQAQPEQAAAALQKLNAFLSGHRDHFRFYHAQQALGTTALIAGDYGTADSAFERLQQSPWPDFQMAGKLGAARSLLKQNKDREAKAIFDQVAGASGASPAERALRLEALLGLAECLQRQDQHQQAAQTLQQVIDQVGASETRLMASAYLQLGHAQAADGQHLKDAVLAYLHVDVIPSLAAHADLHAEALYYLAKLWPAIGHPDRGAEASAKLEQLYPNSEWAKKLSAGL